MKNLQHSVTSKQHAISLLITCAIGISLIACSSSSKVETANEVKVNLIKQIPAESKLEEMAVAEVPPKMDAPRLLEAPMLAPPPAPYIPPSPMAKAAISNVVRLHASQLPVSVRHNAGLDSAIMPTTDTAKYQTIQEHRWKLVTEEPVSTFSADVDTGSYANVRRFIQQGQLPNPDAVRAEEMVNYFSYDYALPKKDAAHPFSVHTQVSVSPWNTTRQLLRIAIKGKDLAKETLPAANLVFLVDVSGSMDMPDRLPLVRSALKLLVAQLRAQDHVSLVTYANGTRVALPATTGDQKSKINLAIEQLTAGGGTNGEAGIKLAYAQAHAGRIQGGINRVLLATDGDLNIGITNDQDLKALVERERKAGISLSTLGVGNDNYNEALMKKLADNGDGSYHYLDSLQEAHKVLVNEYTSTLATIAQDLKLQVEFNPTLVKEYRLIGYELRALTREQFNDDKVDAGDIGAGHAVTALYEIIPKGSKGNIDALRYQTSISNKAQNKDTSSDELAWLKLRYKTPGSEQSQLIETPIKQTSLVDSIKAADQDFRFATAVVAWAQWLRGSSMINNFGPKDILTLANSARGEDRFGHRAEFIRLVELSAALHPAQEKQLSRKSAAPRSPLEAGATSD